ncbi:glucan 1,4-alpha-glucosidase [Neptunitalea chrysea]|uniref:Glucan 1,4-alpha-glucosidase n=1 Tax=Neptunitalea chrysea TaxID=1647581 RepID=A0A9W6B2Q0_9FLAO|nr:glycoside hydrolase family 3 C-terminal domain-containing protein [Neptunitalea chrysea]GLB51174.1 glucan 1,4-alpha-glucosidase [Neptunitalea chrysea]
MIKQFVFCLLVLSSIAVNGQYNFPYQNPELPLEERVADLINNMTLAEKVSQLMSDAPGIERLELPKYNWWNESLHGVARAGYATVFPQSITIAASWDSALVYEVASVISDEARAKHQEYLRRGQRDIYQGLTFWSPNINIFRDPRWGRGHETYGEDPYLTGQLGLAYVKGLQGTDTDYLKVVATAKHFAVHSGPEALRHKFDAQTSDRDLWETYLPAFRTLVTEGKVASVMTAYNRFRGEAASANTFLFDMLRNKWGFDGYVVSDCGAIHDIWKDHMVSENATTASALALGNGTDLNCGTTYEALVQAVEQGLVEEATLDKALIRLFKARFRLGMFDPVEDVAYAQIPYTLNNHPVHDVLARKAAQESIVLLKNKDHILPISKTVKKVAVIGPNANNIQSLWGNYNGVPVHPVTVYEGIKNKLAPAAVVTYAEGVPLAKGIPTMEVIPSIYLETAKGTQGLDAAYFNNHNWEGTPLFVQVDDHIDFNWDIDTPSPAFTMQHYSVRWTGYLKVPETGTYYFSDWGKPYLDFSINDALNGGGKHTHHPKMNPKEIYLEKGKKYAIEIKYSNLYGNAIAQMMWSVPKVNQLQEAIDLANTSDITVLVLGLNERLEGEEMQIDLEGFSGGDRTSLDLPKTQIALLKAMVATGKPLVLVLLNGSALSVNYAAENVQGILTAGYPGQQGGNAIADVLFGDYNPAGRLPVTYYASVNQLPDFEDYSMAGRTYRYFEGKPLFPFGYGLSYTSFEYSNLQLPQKIDITKGIKVTVDVKNTGEMDGDEVVQLYIKDEKGSTPRPIVALKDFDRIHLKKGTNKTVSFIVTPRQLAMINKKGEQVVEPGWFTVYMGGSQPSKENHNYVSKRFKISGSKIVVPF